MIGLGDIAQKAYLPVLGTLDAIEMHLYTRNMNKLNEISRKYRFPNIHNNLSSLIESGIKGAFVHSATDSHEEVVKELLLNDIHVYVDKPITYHYGSTKELVELAKKKNLTLMTGFNRRFAPNYAAMNQVSDINMIILQKNRITNPAEIRTFVYDDFIHCLDTIRFLFPNEIEDILVSGKKKDGLLYQ
ncbi:MAG: gfo/Idh/MocA family oxidoreductase, partial [Neobacillus sp.]|nr:gfo/Idh/MocA family oxidoreductase [Neobacillus sp.]